MAREASMLNMDQLDALGERWRAQGAPLVERLQPGLSDEQIDTQTASLGLTLPAEAKLWWGWHNGADVVPDDPGSSELGPNRAYTPLERAIETYYERREIGRDVGGDEEGAEHVWSRAWFPITAFGDFACDCSVAEGEPTPIRFLNYHYTSTHEVPVVDSFGRMVELWIEAIDSGAWFFDSERRRWLIDFDALTPELELTGVV